MFVAAMRKFDIKKCCCGKTETDIHFIFECQRYDQQRKELKEALQDLCYENWSMEGLLFPFEEELRNEKEMKRRKHWIKRRIDILCALCVYLESTKRFIDGSDGQSEFIEPTDMIL